MIYFIVGMFGDLYIIIFDGKFYIFNGYGEYILMKIEIGMIIFEF